MPPDGVITTEPVAPPKHNTFTFDVKVADSTAAGCVIVTDNGAVEHPFASVTVMVYVPATNAVLSSVLLVPATSAQS